MKLKRIVALLLCAFIVCNVSATAVIGEIVIGPGDDLSNDNYYDNSGALGDNGSEIVVLNGSHVGRTGTMPSGTKIYTEMNTSSSSHTTLFAYEITILEHIIVDGVEWYRFDAGSLLGFFYSDYCYVLASSIILTPLEEIEITLEDGTIVAVSGVPSGATLEVTLPDPDYDYSQAIDDPDFGEGLFCYDISVLDAEGNEWQPDNAPVQVTLTLPELNIAEDSLIRVAHFHGDTISYIDAAFDFESSTITFVTYGFSVFYGYTVDFEYNGEWYSIPVGTGIYLYELFAVLGIDRDVEDVANVVFSDPDLMEVSLVVVDGYTGEQGWYLQSLQAFDTEETLTITFVDEMQIVINVYDQAYNGSFPNNAILVDGDVIAGNITVNSDISITLNGTVLTRGTISVVNGGTLTINGSGTLQRDDEFLLNMFSVERGGTLIINGITIDGGAEWSSTEVPNSTREKLNVTSNKNVTSSAIYVNNGTLSLTNVVIQDSYASAQAPAIHATGSRDDDDFSTITMESVTVRNCATSSSQSITLFNEAVAELKNCEYTNNFSGGTYAGTIKAGGAQYFCQLTMTDCEASGNYSSGWGGVILWAANGKVGNSTSLATIEHCTFTNNKARWLGGAISNEAKMVLKDSTIRGNIAMSGGGIATFPFTLTVEEDIEGDNNANGLTLDAGNIIEDNHAFARDEFTPFSRQDTDSGKETYTSDPTLADDATIGNPITYPAGGGGIWCYMNKDEWTCSLDVGYGNTLNRNESDCMGGGVYVHHVSGEATTLSIMGATISANRAPNGGGVALQNAELVIESGAINTNIASHFGGGIYAVNSQCTVKGVGSVSNNEAAKGGGIYVAEDSGLTVSGGIITENKALCSTESNHTHSQDTSYDNRAECGVGGGIYVAEGNFTMNAATGSAVGLYGNTADYAAADAYASGTNTTLTLPDVEGMDLSGTDFALAEGWFTDNHAPDTYWQLSFPDRDNPGRYYYELPEEQKVMVAAGTFSGYYCLTLGTTFSGYGQLTITKVLTEPITQDQTFVFYVKGVDNNNSGYLMPVLITFTTGEKEKSVTIFHLHEGEYEVWEDTNWSPRYKLISPDNNLHQVTIDVVTPDVDAEFKNELENNQWLTGDCYAENLFCDTSSNSGKDDESSDENP